MKFCSKCGKEIADEAIICTGCGCAVDNAPQPIQAQYQGHAQPAVDEVSVGLCILAFFIPLFGVIYWPLKHKETPKKAKACGITAIISWGVGILFSILWSVLFGSIFAGLMYL